MWLSVVVTTLSLAVECWSEEDIEAQFNLLKKEPVQTSSGKLLGTGYGELPYLYESWVDIQYALPRDSTTSQRFKKAELFLRPLNNETIDVGGRSPVRCLQYNFIPEADFSFEHDFNSEESGDPNWHNFIQGKEDYCQRLSIYRPFDIVLSNLHTEELGVENKNLASVMVVLQPGTFMYDIPFDARKFVNNTCCYFAITAVVNYRLGPLGFLSSGWVADADEDSPMIPANLGLLDQVTALAWIQLNIRLFQGDPGKVTLIGALAGAVSVHLHMMSTYSQGLFQKAISYSGSALVPWALGRNLLKKTKLWAQDMPGCDKHKIDENRKAILECLHAQHTDDNITEWIALSPKFYGWLNTPLSPLGPQVDYDFLDDEPLMLLRGGAVQNKPWIVSMTSAAGTLPAGYMWEGKGLQVNLEWSQLAKHIMDFEFTIDPLLHKWFANVTRKTYTSKNNINITQDPFIRMLTDRLYITGITEAARLQGLIGGARHPVYLYKFNYQATHGIDDELLGKNQFHGPGPADDFMTFVAAQYNNTFENSSVQLQKQMAHMVMTYVQEGRPRLSQAFFDREIWEELLEKEKNRSASDALHSGELPKTPYLYDTKFHFKVEYQNNMKINTLQQNYLPSFIVTYCKIVHNRKLLVVRSNNLGEGKFWRRAPFLYPKIYPYIRESHEIDPDHFANYWLDYDTSDPYSKDYVPHHVK